MNPPSRARVPPALTKTCCLKPLRAAKRVAEARAPSWVARHVHGAAVCLDQSSGYRQAEAGPGGVVCPPGARPLCSEGALEDAGQIFGGDALAGVGDLDPDLLPLRRGAQGDGAVDRGVAQGV